MVLVLQVVSFDPLGVAGIESAPCVQACLANRLLPHAANEAEALTVWISLGCFLSMAAPSLLPLRLCAPRADSPGSRFPASTFAKQMKNLLSRA
jgi:hypothetical protein